MKRTFSVLLLFIIGIAGYARLGAQTSTPITAADSLNVQDYYRNPSYGIGLMAGLVSGAGLSGRATFPGGIAAQGTFFVMTFGKWTHFNIGAEGQYSFIRQNDWRLYSLLGLGYYSSHTSDTAYPGNRIANPFRLGLGIGYETFIGQQFVFSIAGALTYFPTTSEVFPTPEAGFYFYFR
jgi:hypothetical protein